MTTDPTRPAGDDAQQERRPTRQDITTTVRPQVVGTPAASQFIRRVSQLDIESIRAAVQTWRDLMRADSDAWFAAERAAGHAVLAAGRTAEQQGLLSQLAEGVLRGVWYDAARGRPPATPEAYVGATEASGQYIGSVAMLALLVRDHLPAPDFALLYRPFARLIPLEELARE